MLLHSFFTFLLLLSTIAAETVRIAFGSCNRQYLPQTHWDAIHSWKPDAFLWTGDIIYPTCNKFSCIQEAYQQLSSSVEYQNFKDSVQTIDGIYDDHDFGENDGGKHVKVKEEARTALLDFLQVPPSSPRRTNPHGAYTSFYLSKKKQIKVIILDTRFSRGNFVLPSFSHLHSKRVPIHIFGALSRYTTSILGLKNPNNDILGPEQWKWLEKELSSPDPLVTIIVSSIQVMTTFPLVESWGLFEASKKKLFQTFRDSKAKNIILLSGDVHYGEIQGLETDGIIEITSSGLTHSGLGRKIKKLENLILNNAYNISSYEGNWRGYLYRFAHVLFDKLGLGKNLMRLKSTPLLVEKNFGLLDIILPEENELDQQARAIGRVLPLSGDHSVTLSIDINLDKVRRSEKFENTLARVEVCPLSGGFRPLPVVLGTVVVFILVSLLKRSGRNGKKKME